jgi:hypothetical protein
LNPSFVPQPLPSPIDPTLVENDCMALQQEAAVQSYIAGLEAQMDTSASQAQACVQNVRQLACQVLDLVPAAVEKCGDPLTSELCPIPVVLLAFADPASSGDAADLETSFDGFLCLKCRGALLEQRAVVKDAARGLASCQKEADELASRRNGLVAFLASESQPPSAFGLDNRVGSLADGARASGDRAEAAVEQVDAALENFAEVGGACSHESLVESCEECDGGATTLPPPMLSGAVKAQQSAKHLGELAAAFKSESRRTTDIVLQDQYAELARRLRDIPRARVLDVTAPTGEPFSQSYVTLRRSGVPDDGRSPLAVVLTFVRSRNCRLR